VIQRHIAACLSQAELNKSLFTQGERTSIATNLESFTKRLNEMKENPNLEALKQLDNEVNKYVRDTFQRLLVQTKKKGSIT
jgi:hypothetical protein